MLLFFAANLTDEQRTWFITHFKKLCKIGILSEKEKEKRDKEALENSTSNKIVSISLTLWMMVKGGKGLPTVLHNPTSSIHLKENNRSGIYCLQIDNKNEVFGVYGG